jgi:hypothetical protein
VEQRPCKVSERGGNIVEWIGDVRERQQAESGERHKGPADRLPLKQSRISKCQDISNREDVEVDDDARAGRMQSIERYKYSKCRQSHPSCRAPVVEFTINVRGCQCMVPQR